MTLTVHQGDPKFDLAAEGLGGTIQLIGRRRTSRPTRRTTRSARRSRRSACSSMRSGVRLGTSGPLADLRGRASVKGRVQARGGLDLEARRGRGSVELDEPIWGYQLPAGEHAPGRGEQVPGRLAGRSARRRALRRQGARRRDLDVSRRGGPAAVRGRLRARAADAGARPELPARGRTAVRRAWARCGSPAGPTEPSRGRSSSASIAGSVNSLELTDAARAGRVDVLARARPGGARCILRKAAGRLAGGRVGGEAHFTLGDRRDFRARLFVDDVDLRVISRDELGSRPVPGRLSGYRQRLRHRPGAAASYRGDLDFDLDQASLVDIPLLDELDRSLGSAQGGVFDDGDISRHHRRPEGPHRPPDARRPAGPGPRHRHGRLRRAAQPGGGRQHQPGHSPSAAR